MRIIYFAAETSLWPGQLHLSRNRQGAAQERILCLFLVFGACPSRGDDCKPHRSGPSDGRGGFLSSIRFKDPLVPQGALEKELGDLTQNAGQCVPNLGPKRLAAVPPRGERSGLGPGGER